MAELDPQLESYRLTTAHIYYHLPDHAHILQEFLWQNYDLPPRFPVLSGFLDFWSREIHGKLHSVYIAQVGVISAGDCRFAAWQEELR